MGELRLNTAEPPELQRLIGAFAILAVTHQPDVPLQRFLATIVSPIRLGQFRVYCDADGKPIAGMVWAFFDRQSEEEYLQTGNILGEKNWCSGDRAWVVEFIDCGGLTRSMIRELYYEIMVDHTVDYGKRYRSDGTFRVGRWVRRRDPDSVGSA